MDYLTSDSVNSLIYGVESATLALKLDEWFLRFLLIFCSYL